jgi:hypothetical protein
MSFLKKKRPSDKISHIFPFVDMEPSYPYPIHQNARNFKAPEGNMLIYLGNRQRVGGV